MINFEKNKLIVEEILGDLNLNDFSKQYNKQLFNKFYKQLNHT